MTKLHYKSINVPMLSEHPLILISDVDNKATDSLSVSVSDKELTYVIINDRKLKLNGGKAEIPLKDVADGISEVTFIAGTKKIPASPFFKKEKAIYRIPLDSRTVNAFEELLVFIATKLTEAEKRLTALEEKTTPKNMFKFNHTT